MRLTGFLIVIFICLSLRVHAEFDFSGYEKLTISEIKIRHAEDLLKAAPLPGYIVSANAFKYALPVSFTKRLRNLSKKNASVIKAWQKTLRVPDDFINLYKQEFKIVFGDEIYWVPVQEELLPHMGTELHPGDKFELYVIVIGAIDNKLVFLATEFRSDRAPL